MKSYKEWSKTNENIDSPIVNNHPTIGSVLSTIISAAERNKVFQTKVLEHLSRAIDETIGMNEEQKVAMKNAISSLQGVKLPEPMTQERDVEF